MRSNPGSVSSYKPPVPPPPNNAKTAELWDMTRPLIGSCTLQLLKFDDPEAKAVFWHSSAHVLGQALEKKYGAHLTIGPPVQDGFYYDCYMGDRSVRACN